MMQHPAIAVSLRSVLGGAEPDGALVAAFEGEFDKGLIHVPGVVTVALLVAGPPVESRLNRHGVGTVLHRPGTCSLLHADDDRWWRSQGPALFRHFYLPAALLDDIAADRLGARRFRPETLPLSFALPDFTRLEAAFALRAQATPLAAMELEAWRVLFASILVGARPEGACTGAAMLSPNELARALDYMQANLAANPSLADVARVLGMSTSRFARAFRAAAGGPPHRRLLAMKLADARARIEDGGQSLADIAVASGFSSQAHMTTAFVKCYGVTPGALRKIGRAPQRPVGKKM
jgi:AraC-like DNA-binding protein